MNLPGWVWLVAALVIGAGLVMAFMYAAGKASEDPLDADDHVREAWKRSLRNLRRSDDEGSIGSESSHSVPGCRVGERHPNERDA